MWLNAYAKLAKMQEMFYKNRKKQSVCFATEIKNLNYLKIIVIIQKYQNYMKVAFIIINNI